MLHQIDLNKRSLIGLSSERYDIQDEGPDVLWLLPEKVGLVVEARSRKKKKTL